MKSAGLRRHQVELFGPGASVPDGDGGFTETWSALSPETEFVSIEPATARNMERLFANTIVASSTHLVTMRYRPDVTMKSRLIFGTRSFSVVGMQDPEERHIEWILACVEIFDAPPVVVDDSWVQGDWIQ